MSKIKITPLADRVIIKQAEAETTTASGIIIPDTAQEKPQKGIVIAVGKGTKDNPILIKYAQLEGKKPTDGFTISEQSKMRIKDRFSN